MFPVVNNCFPKNLSFITKNTYWGKIAVTFFFFVVIYSVINIKTLVSGVTTMHAHILESCDNPLNKTGNDIIKRTHEDSHNCVLRSATFFKTPYILNFFCRGSRVIIFLIYDIKTLRCKEIFYH